MTQVIQVRNVSAAQLVPILRPLIPQYGHLAAYPSSNMLIISDRAANVNRMVRIIQRIDSGGDSDIDIIRLDHASSAEIVRVINALTAAQGAEGAGGAKIVADERTNSVLLSGEASQRLRLRALITHIVLARDEVVVMDMEAGIEHLGRGTAESSWNNAKKSVATTPLIR